MGGSQRPTSASKLCLRRAKFNASGRRNSIQAGLARSKLLIACEPLNKAVRMRARSGEDSCSAVPALVTANRPRKYLARGGSAQPLMALAQTAFFMVMRQSRPVPTDGFNVTLAFTTDLYACRGWTTVGRAAKLRLPRTQWLRLETLPARLARHSFQDHRPWGS